MTKYPPKGVVVLSTAMFNGENYKQPKADADEKMAVYIPRAEVATLDEAYKTFQKRVTWIRFSGVALSKILTNCIAYGDRLAHIEKEDWEMMCRIEAFDHIYLDCDLNNEELVYDIRVSIGPWKVDR